MYFLDHEIELCGQIPCVPNYLAFILDITHVIKCTRFSPSLVRRVWKQGYMCWCSWELVLQSKTANFKKSSLRASWARKRAWNAYHLLLKEVSQFSPYMAIEKPYKCMATFRGFDKVLTWEFLYLQVGKHLRVEICKVASLGHRPYTVQVWDLN